ncbi:MAG: hypothetical protein ACJAZO_002417 [Myxococcota bacterium]|jgi:hypothetical protein
MTRHRLFHEPAAAGGPNASRRRAGGAVSMASYGAATTSKAANACARGVGLRRTNTGVGTSRWTSWSVLLCQVLNVNGVACPTCGRMTTLRAVVRPPASRMDVA